MKQADNNPSANSLAPGVDEAALATAIAKSGYPLQLVVAARLRQDFHVQEEWAYVDSNSGDLRSLDLLAGRDLWDRAQKQPRVRPVLNLLVECKQAQLPLVFFLSEGRPFLYEFPYLSGLFKYSISVSTDDSRSTWQVPIVHALDIRDLPFFATEPHFSSFFSKVVRKGSDLELSGTEAYHGIVLPVLKAIRHFRSVEKPPDTAYYFDCHLCIGLAVVDAPMVGVTVTKSGHELSALPWVRVTRHEYLDEADRWDRSQLLA